MVTDSIADLLTRIRNAGQVGHPTVIVMKSKMNERMLSVLKNEGFIAGFDVVRAEGETIDKYKVYLKYDENGLSAITGSKRVSKSGRRVYSGVEGLPKIHRGLGVTIISTSQGVMTDREARKRGIGGEVLGLVY